MSVSDTFISSLLASGDSDAGGSGDPDANAGTGDRASSAGAGEQSGSGQPGKEPGSSANAAGGAVPAGQDQPSSEAGKQPDTGQSGAPGQQPAVAEPAKPVATGDDPAIQVTRLNGALREVRGENKELKEQLRKQGEQLASFQQQITALGQPKQPAMEPEADPDFLSDPKAYVDKNTAATRAAVEKLEKGEAERAEQAKQMETMQQQWGEVLTKESEFAEATPDYQQAIQFVRGIRVQAFSAEFEAMHDRAPTQQEISKAITGQEIQAALQLHGKGKNPAQWYYGYAKALGYKTPAAPADPAPAVEAAKPTEPAPAAQTKPAAAKPDKEAVRSMGSGGGSGTPPDEDANRDPMAALLGTVHGEMTAKRRARKA